MYMRVHVCIPLCVVSVIMDNGFTEWEAVIATVQLDPYKGYIVHVWVNKLSKVRQLDTLKRQPAIYIVRVVSKKKN